MESGEIRVRAMWDTEARVWVAESDDVPGLITEAESTSALKQKLEVLIPELLHENHVSFAQPHLKVFVDHGLLRILDFEIPGSHLSWI